MAPITVADLAILPLLDNAIGAVNVEAEEVLEPIVGVEAAAIRAELDYPGPDLFTRGVDRDRTGQLSGRFPHDLIKAVEMFRGPDHIAIRKGARSIVCLPVVPSSMRTSRVCG